MCLCAGGSCKCNLKATKGARHSRVAYPLAYLLMRKLAFWQACHDTLLVSWNE